MDEGLADCYGTTPLENIGYAIADFDGNGRLELAVGATNAISDAFYGKVIFDLYTVDENGCCIEVFSSGARNRYYYAGEYRFANIGSDSAATSFETTVKLQDTEILDMTQTTSPTDYVQLELSAFEG